MQVPKMESDVFLVTLSTVCYIMCWKVQTQQDLDLTSWVLVGDWGEKGENKGQLLRAAIITLNLMIWAVEGHKLGHFQ